MNDAPMLLVPVAIRDDVMVRLHFPADITRDEAEKVARVILAYAHPSSPSNPEQQSLKG